MAAELAAVVGELALSNERLALHQDALSAAATGGSPRPASSSAARPGAAPTSALPVRRALDLAARLSPHLDPTDTTPVLVPNPGPAPAGMLPGQQRRSRSALRSRGAPLPTAPSAAVPRAPSVPPDPRFDDLARAIAVLTARLEALSAAMPSALPVPSAAAPPPSQAPAQPAPLPPPLPTSDLAGAHVGLPPPPPAALASPAPPPFAAAPVVGLFDAPLETDRRPKTVFHMSLGASAATITYKNDAVASHAHKVAVALSRCPDARFFGSDSAVRTWLARCPYFPNATPAALARAHTALRVGRLPALTDLLPVSPDCPDPSAASAPLQSHHLPVALRNLILIVGFLYGHDCPLLPALADYEADSLLLGYYARYSSLYGPGSASVHRVCATFAHAATSWFTAADRALLPEFTAAVDSPGPDGTISMGVVPLPLLTTYFSHGLMEATTGGPSVGLHGSLPSAPRGRAHAGAGAGAGTGGRGGRGPSSGRPPTAPSAPVAVTLAGRASWPADLTAAVTDNLKGLGSVGAIFTKHPVLRSATVDGKPLCVRYLLGGSSPDTGCSAVACPRHHL